MPTALRYNPISKSTNEQAGRVVAELYSQDNQNISDALLKEGLARIYGKETGFTKIDWCN